MDHDTFAVELLLKHWLLVLRAEAQMKAASGPDGDILQVISEINLETTVY